MQNPCQKEKCDFKAKIAGWKNRAECVDKCVYKNVYGNTFLYAVQNTKGPAEAEPKICQQKRKWVRDLSWSAFGPSTGSGTLFIRFCLRLCAMISQVLLPRKANAATVLARALLSRRAATPQVENPLYIVECFRRCSEFSLALIFKS